MNSLVGEFRSRKFKEKGLERGKKVVKESMFLKMQDERQKHEELEQDKKEARRETEEIYG